MVGFDDEDLRLGEEWLPSCGLIGYVHAVAAVLGLSPEATFCETGHPSAAYIALEQRVKQFPDRDVALLWDEESGWCVALETGTTDDPIALSWLGRDVLPTPGVVREFIDLIMRGRLPGTLDQPRLRCTGDDDGLAGRLAAYDTERW
ncbi:DUF6292 family protein [Lentzea sp. NPDC006480]|uniref:DUF6292 family protein n=1 Tax=Lentzea sp. NPDC006480 TaxID=3157176 RepID=UPI0033B8C340